MLCLWLEPQAKLDQERSGIPILPVSGWKLLLIGKPSSHGRIFPFVDLKFSDEMTGSFSNPVFKCEQVLGMFLEGKLYLRYAGPDLNPGS